MLPPVYTWSLTAIAVVAGLAMGWLFRLASDQERVALAKRKLRAHLLALRLYADEPALVFRAQKQLLFWNVRYLALMLRPTAVLFVPASLLLFLLQAFYGHRVLAPGESAIVTAQFREGNSTRMPEPILEGRHVVVETPAVRIPVEDRACWRVRVTDSVSGSVVLRLNGVALAKSVQTGAGFGPIAERRVSSLFDWLRYPGESRLPAGPVRWIEISYPPVTVNVLGFGLPWLAWFGAVSLLAMLAGPRS